MNRLLDSNIVIYYSKAKFAFLTPFFTSSQTYVSAISIPEVFGFANLTPHEEKALHQVFRKLHTHEVTQSVLYKAAQLRRNKKIIVIDAIIAATALEHGCELVTRNENDFKGIAGLSIFNPFKQP